MKPNKTVILIIADRSGSMAGTHSDLVGGLNALIKDQQALQGECYVSVKSFDERVEDVITNVEIGLVKGFSTKEHFIPRGSTALLDAIGLGINDLGASLDNLKEKDKPSKVIVVIYTDGHENASKEFSKQKIKEMISHQREVYSWEFVFLAAGQDAILTGNQFGISASTSLSFTNSPMGNSAAISSVSHYLSSSRAGVSSSDLAFTEGQRSAALAS